MNSIENMLDNYAITNALFYLIENTYFQKLHAGGINIKDLQDPLFQDVISLLVQKEVIFVENNYYRFSPSFSQDLDKITLWKLFLSCGYKNYLGAPQEAYMSELGPHKNKKLIAAGSSLLARESNMKMLRGFLTEHTVHSFLDVGCWDGSIILSLAKEFLDITFYGIELGEELCQAANLKIQTAQLTNIHIRQADATQGIPLNEHIDLVFWSFVFHEFIYDQSIDGTIKNFLQTLTPNYFLLREFTPTPDVMNHQHQDYFFLIYQLIHTTSRQKTFDIKRWEKLFFPHQYTCVGVKHIQQFSPSDSLYPLMIFERNT